jgi:hypothetical protein
VKFSKSANRDNCTRLLTGATTSKDAIFCDQANAGAPIRTLESLRRFLQQRKIVVRDVDEFEFRTPCAVSPLRTPN